MGALTVMAWLGEAMLGLRCWCMELPGSRLQDISSAFSDCSVCWMVRRAGWSRKVFVLTFAVMLVANVIILRWVRLVGYDRRMEPCYGLGVRPLSRPDFCMPSSRH